MTATPNRVPVSACAQIEYSLAAMQSSRQSARPEMPQPLAWQSPAEELHALNRALEAITDLITPPSDSSPGMGHVGRDAFSGLLQLLIRIREEGSELADFVPSCYSSIADLMIPEDDMHCVSRDHLASLLHVILMMQKDALARLFAEQKEMREKPSLNSNAKE